ncbi:response regulator [Pedobacter yulinensis]|nr:response regulator [Pedobacter yulinensis]
MNKKILVCDDDEGILEMMELFLEDAGYEVIAVRESVNVLSEAASRKPNLIILDIWMPVISGDRILRSLRAQEPTASIPVILFSASREGQGIAEREGANGFVSKPFNLDELLQQISEKAS